MEENGFSFPSLPPPKALPKQASPHISSHSSPSNHLITCTGCAISTITPTVFQLCVFHSLAQNPLLQNATVIDRTATTTTAAMPSSSSPAQPQPQPQISAMPPPAPKTVTPAPLVAPNRKKVPFEKGYSQMDWVRLTQSGADLTGLGKGSRPRKDITMQEVKLHKTLEDGWTVLRGKVYNLTPYIKFHPGGATILKGILGKDGTVLFNKYHAWVNAEFLLAKCLVGTLAVEDAGAAASIDA